MRPSAALATLATAASVAGLVVLGAGQDYPPARVQLRAGTVWLASTQLGQVTLVDGASAEVAARVPVAAPGSPLRVVQQGGAAYVVNQATLRRVDGATHKASRPVTPIPDASDALTLLPAQDKVYTVDTRSGIIAAADPKTLAPQGRPRRLAAGITSFVVDSRGQPWVARTGQLAWLSGGQRRIRPMLPGSPHLTMTNGQPALVDPARGTAELLDPDTGAVIRSARIRQGDEVAVSGSPNRSRVLLSVGDAFIACTFDTTSCTTPLTIGADLGAPVEIGNHAVVPDYATGRAAIIDLTTMRLIAQRQLFDRTVRFELLVRDGIIFFNDPNGNRAGVLDLTGKVRFITKYKKTDDGRATVPDLAGGPESAATKRGTGIPGWSSGTRAPDPTGPTPPTPAVSIVVKPRNHGLVGEKFELALVPRLAGIARIHWKFGDGTGADGAIVQHRWSRPGTFPIRAEVTLKTGEQTPAATTTIVIEPAGTPPRIDHLNIKRSTPVIGERVHFSADIAGSQPEKWQWTLSGPRTTGSTTIATTPDGHHTFTEPGIYNITLTVATNAGSAHSSRDITVTLGKVKAWGDNSSGQISVPIQATSGVVAIAAGDGHNLVLKADGSVIGWGYNDFEQASVPTQATSGVVAIAAGGFHSLVLKADGSVIGWGNNEFEQASVPTQATSGVVAIAAGAVHSLALKADGSVIGWGGLHSVPWSVPPQATSGVVAIAAGLGHSMALKADGSVIVWIENFEILEPVPPQAASGVVAIAAGGAHSLALKADGSVIGWGDNFFEQVSVPATASGSVAIAAGSTHSLALKADGSVIGWGDNSDEQVSIPPTASGSVAIAAGGLHSLAL